MERSLHKGSMAPASPRRRCRERNRSLRTSTRTSSMGRQVSILLPCHGFCVWVPRRENQFLPTTGAVRLPLSCGQHCPPACPAGWGSSAVPVRRIPNCAAEGIALATAPPPAQTRSQRLTCESRQPRSLQPATSQGTPDGFGTEPRSGPTSPRPALRSVTRSPAQRRQRSRSRTAPKSGSSVEPAHRVRVSETRHWLHFFCMIRPSFESPGSPMGTRDFRRRNVR